MHVFGMFIPQICNQHHYQNVLQFILRFSVLLIDAFYLFILFRFVLNIAFTNFKPT